MKQINRLSGGQIDRSQTLSFTFDGKAYCGHPGDTLASALLANNVRLMGRSFKYHRPRGPLSAGSEEPNALVELREGSRQEPNTRATTAELFDGLVARSQNRWPSLTFDVMGVNDWLSPFLAAGFYYKTFMWPKQFWERLYEPIIRRAAGLGSLSMEPDPDQYDKGFLHCDLLIIGAGPAGLAAALTAGRAGARIILADEDFQLGGRLNSETFQLDNKPGSQWVAQARAELEAMDNVRVMARTAITGTFDHGVYSALERVSDHQLAPAPGKPRQTLWRITTKRALLCAGAIERAIAFPNNDRPGIMLASALRAYANRYAVTPGRCVALFTNNDDGLRTAKDLAAKGVTIAAIVDTRRDTPALSPDPDIRAEHHFRGAEIVDTRGHLGLKSITVRTLEGELKTIACDALGVSGGWNPNVHLASHQRQRPVWRDDISAFVPGDALPAGMMAAGAAQGDFSTQACLHGGTQAARAALLELGIEAPAMPIPDQRGEGSAFGQSAVWHIENGRRRAWVDQQNDVTVKDIKLSHQEGFRAVEHLKRYTTLGMATDQGKTANVTGLAVMAELTGQTIAQTGTTMFRPPYAPTAIGAFAGRHRDENFRPVRKTPSHKWAQERGAIFVETGMWLRAQWFPRPGETHWRESVDREVLATRRSVGVCDVTTLGKIDIQGGDAAVFLNRVYCNAFAKLPVGKVRYGLMLREDGIVMDDGTTAHLTPNHYVMTTTTANAGSVFRHLEFCRQCLWPDLDVHIISTTDAWAQFAIAGPNARNLLRKIVDAQFDLSNEAFPFMACADITVCNGLRARLFRISFSGELAYELAVPTGYGDALIRELMAQGEEFDVVPYGTEALGVMRIEKGHAAGNELNGTTSALNLGMGRMVSKKKDSIGSILSEREGMNADDALSLTGFKPVDPTQTFAAGSHFIPMGGQEIAHNDQGYMTSVCHSPTLGHTIGLGLLKAGSQRMGERLLAVNPLMGQRTEVEVVSAHFVDPEGERLRG
ncbi:MAG: sarcosine oxidase subunit alpha family protein [Pseudomonadota bacterium]